MTKSDLSSWVNAHAVALNGGVVAVTILGVVAQTWTAPPADVEEIVPPPEVAPVKPAGPWWKLSFAKAE